MRPNEQYNKVIISGISGSGKSTALHTLEDLGFFCTDNLPVEMLSAWESSAALRKKPLAVCLDSRSSKDARKIYDEMGIQSDWKLIFTEASDTCLLRRYSTVRRIHPFSPDDTLNLSIQRERIALAPLKAMANLVIDSSNLNPYELAAIVEEYCLKNQSLTPASPNVLIESFSYQRGLPEEADIVFDARFLPNPYYEKGLATQTGMDSDVKKFFARHTDVAKTAELIQQWILFIWPKLGRERKKYLTVAIGCSGGRHRSVFLTEQLAEFMRSQNMGSPTTKHRELT